MTYEGFIQIILLVIFVSFAVERSLAVIFETRYYIRRFSQIKGLKPSVAAVYGMILVFAVDVNLAKLIRIEGTSGDFSYVWAGEILCWANFQNLFIIAVTGFLVAGGSKASLKLFSDVMNIKSSDEALRKAPTTSAPAYPVDAAAAAAKGNGEAEHMLINLFEASGLPRVGKP